MRLIQTLNTCQSHSKGTVKWLVSRTDESAVPDSTEKTG